MQKNIMMEIIDKNLDVTQEENQIWRVTDDLKADWTLDKIREIKAEYKRFELVANDRIQQLQMSFDAEEKKLKLKCCTSYQVEH